MIRVNEVSKSFEHPVLKNVSFSVNDGDIMLISGKSGAGKTTLLNILMGILNPDSGNIIGMPTKKSAVFQEDRLLDNMDYFSNMHLTCNQSDEELLAEFKVLLPNEDPQKKMKEFSGGMRRRVCILRAMLCSSDVLFLDEPFKGLDEKTKIVTMNYVLSKRNGRTLFLVTHDKDEIAAFCPNKNYFITAEEN